MERKEWFPGKQRIQIITPIYKRECKKSDSSSYYQIVQVLIMKKVRQHLASTFLGCHNAFEDQPGF